MTHLNYLPSFRKRHGLFQREVARLIDVDRTTVAKYESAECLPTLAHALAIEALFGISVSAMVSDLYAHIMDEVVLRAAELERSIAGKTDARSMKIQRFLAELMDRATRTPGV